MILALILTTGLMLNYTSCTHVEDILSLYIINNYTKPFFKIKRSKVMNTYLTL